MPAIAEEIEEALEEGVGIDYLAQPVTLQEVRGNGAKRHYQLGCRRMKLGEPDETGRRAPLEIEGSDFGIVCHRVILALGQSPDVSVFPEGTEVREGTRLLGNVQTPIDDAVGNFLDFEGNDKCLPRTRAGRSCGGSVRPGRTETNPYPHARQNCERQHLSRPVDPRLHSQRSWGRAYAPAGGRE